MSFMSEVREFAVKGNVVDLAVGVIIGAAFGKIVDSLVKDVIMPLINVVTGGSVDFSQKYLVLSGSVPPGTPLEAAQKAGIVLAWGNFVTIVINFVILAFVIFWMVRQFSKAKAKLDPEVTPPAVPDDVALLREIRDLLRAGR